MTPEGRRDSEQSFSFLLRDDLKTNLSVRFTTSWDITLHAKGEKMSSSGVWTLSRSELLKFVIYLVKSSVLLVSDNMILFSAQFVARPEEKCCARAAVWVPWQPAQPWQDVRAKRRQTGTHFQCLQSLLIKTSWHFSSSRDNDFKIHNGNAEIDISHICTQNLKLQPAAG